MGGRGGGSSSSALGQALKKAAAMSLVDMVRQAFANTVEPGRNWVRLPEIRRELAAMGLSREDQDAAIRDFAVAPGSNVVPIANLKALRPEDREAAIRLGGEMKHMISVSRSV